MKRLFALSFLAVSVLWGQEDTRSAPWEAGTISIGEIETYPPPGFVFENESGLAIVTIDMETGNVTIADGIEMNEASRKFWKMLQEVAGRQEDYDCSATTDVPKGTIALGNNAIPPMDSFGRRYWGTEWITSPIIGSLSCRHHRPSWQHLTLNNDNPTLTNAVRGDLTVAIGTRTLHIGSSSLATGCTSLRIEAGGVVCNDPTTGDTWVTTKGDPSTSTNLKSLETK